MKSPRFLFSSILLLLALLLVVGLSASQAAAQEGSTAIYRGVSTAVKFDISPPMREITPTSFVPTVSEIPERESVLEGPFGPQSVDPVVQESVGPSLIPGPIISFDGPPNIYGVAPPDPVGDVGPNHYVAMSNLSWQVFDKAGVSLLGPLPNNSLWAGFGGDCENENAGDPIVLYDQFADRWYLTQFTSPSAAPFYNCVAVSTSGDPTGTYYRYAFSTGANFPDYPKYGIWHDALYISTREFAGPLFAGVGAYAVDRAALIAGNPAPTVISFLVPPGGTPFNIGDGLLPTDLDGINPPPAGSPNYFVGTMDDGAGIGAPIDAINIWEFAADFTNPPASTFTLASVVPVAPFDSIFPCAPGSRDCIPQPATAQKIDFLVRQRPLHRLAYRNFGSHEALAINQSVEAAPGIAGIRWYELRNPGGAPVVYQQGTYAPGVGDGIHRWMGSIAMDRNGNMALGYSASDGISTYPSSWYTGRLASDPLGTMPQGEGSIINGTGSQTGSARWGDYTSMNVDPVDDCTFWYVNEYLPVTSPVGWQLRIGAFKFPNCVFGGGSITTFFATDNGFAGNMFDLTNIGVVPITITSFDINLETGGTGALISVFSYPGSYVGHENDPSGWTLMGTDTVDAAGTDLPTPVAVGGLTVNPGESYGLYVTVTNYPSGRMLYTNGANVFSNGEVRLDLGVGKGDPDFTGSTFNPRTWNGTIYYSTAAPNIDVDPLSMGSTQGSNTTTVLPLDISNTGTADLDWAILEENTALPPEALDTPPFVAGDQAPSAGMAPNDAPAAMPVVTEAALGSNAYAWNSNGPYYTVFDIDVPGTLPNVAPFPAGGNFVGGGEYYNGLVYMVDVANIMYEVDPVTGAVLNTYPATAPAGGETYSGMALDPTTGIVYAMSTSVTTSSLFTIDPTTGVATLIGPLPGMAGAIAMSFDGSGDLYGYDIVADAMFAINKATAGTTNLGPLPFDANFGQGMGYDPATDTVYLAAFNNGAFQAELWSYDTGTNGYAFLGVLGNVVPGGLNQLSWLGFESAGPAACDPPSDIPWLSTSPSSGTTAPATTDTVDVTFDSTGLLAGTYTGNLCVTSNDPDPGPGNGTDLVVVPVELIVEPEPEIDLVKTVGLDPLTCAGSNTLTVDPGTVVYYCYEVTNTGNITLTLHDLDDSELGNQFTGFAYDLAPGASVDTVAAGLEISATIDVTTVNTATWTAYNAGPTDTAVAEASATAYLEDYPLFLPAIISSTPPPAQPAAARPPVSALPAILPVLFGGLFIGGFALRRKR